MIWIDPRATERDSRIDWSSRADEPRQRMPWPSPRISELERVRFLGAEMLLAGARQAEVARKLGVSRMAVSRWNAALMAGESLRARKATGRPRG